jgi:hypothetical protein
MERARQVDVVPERRGAGDEPRILAARDPVAEDAHGRGPYGPDACAGKGSGRRALRVVAVALRRACGWVKAVLPSVAAALLDVLGLKLAVLRWWHGLGRFLALLGASVFVLPAVTWFTSAGDFLAEGE